MRRILLGLVVAIAAFALPAAAHPLDALSGEEIETAVAALREAGDVDGATRFTLIDLDEPPKPAVLAGQPFARKAFAIARRDRTVFEGVVDLATRRVERWRQILRVQTGIALDEWVSAQKVTIADPQWQAAMKKRGYTAFDKLFCAPFTVGYDSAPRERALRLLKVGCFDTEGTRNNVWGRPIEGLYALVDVDAAKVVRLIDTGPVPVSRETHAYDEASQPSLRPALKPVVIRATDGANFTTDRSSTTGGEVRWNRWSFHWRMDRRVGLVLSLLQYEDQGRERMVLYRGSIAEMFVPYMDDHPGWASRTYMDVGEYGFGELASELRPGVDCPADAAFFDAVLPNDEGKPETAKSVVCLFERDTGAPLWRHDEIVNHSWEGRPAIELVLRMIASIGNYDYVTDWVLTEAGVLRIDVGSTGVDQVKGVPEHRMADRSHGMLVAANLVSINHDHFLSFRLDVDIDGPANTLMQERLVPRRLPGKGDRRSLWTVEEQPVAREGPLAPVHGGAEIWRIVNPAVTNKFGQHPGYELSSGHSATSLLLPEDFAQRRAAFSGSPLWITAYDPNQLYAGGTYPNQSPGGDGLPAFVARHRPVAGADIVLWYTMGFHHLPRPEDWPILSTMWHSVALAPWGFFDHNPSLDLRREFAGVEPGK
jgi:primary-amine oxidase